MITTNFFTVFWTKLDVHFIPAIFSKKIVKKKEIWNNKNVDSDLCFSNLINLLDYTYIQLCRESNLEFRCYIQKQVFRICNIFYTYHSTLLKYFQVLAKRLLLKRNYFSVPLDFQSLLNFGIKATLIGLERAIRSIGKFTHWLLTI